MTDNAGLPKEPSKERIDCRNAELCTDKEWQNDVPLRQPRKSKEKKLIPTLDLHGFLCDTIFITLTTVQSIPYADYRQRGLYSFIATYRLLISVTAISPASVL